MIVTRIFKPITREVNSCHECPYFRTEQDMSMTHPICDHPDFHADKRAELKGYANIIDDVSPWHGRNDKISKDCPLI